MKIDTKGNSKRTTFTVKVPSNTQMETSMSESGCTTGSTATESGTLLELHPFKVLGSMTLGKEVNKSNNHRIKSRLMSTLLKLRKMLHELVYIYLIIIFFIF